jgi:RNA recognition motif-containing protein
VQEEDIIAMFNTATHEFQLEGTVEGVRLVKDPKTNVGKGIGYVLFKHRTAAVVALNLDGVECKGRKMRVQRVKAQPVATQSTRGAKKGGRLAAKGPHTFRDKAQSSKQKSASAQALVKKVAGDAESMLLSFVSLCTLHDRPG